MFEWIKKVMETEYKFYSKYMLNPNFLEDRILKRFCGLLREAAEVVQQRQDDHFRKDLPKRNGHVVCERFGMRATLCIASIVFASFNVNAQRNVKPKLNLPYHGSVNPFRELMGLSPTRTSLNRDSARIHLNGGGSIDLILRRKRPWRFHQYDSHGNLMDTGDLENGQGRIHFVDGDRMCDMEFVDSELNGSFSVNRRLNGDWVPYINGTFKDGLLDGEYKQQSSWDPRYTAALSRSTAKASSR